MVSLPARRADDPDPLPPKMSSESRFKPELEELSSRLAEQGIQSNELVLDLVLHDLADEACHMVSASGAAIALEREGELVCRAAAGSTAPDLGVRIHMESGLSGICVKQGTTQLCNDTESDDRVDAQACRHLGVRSIVVFPLFAVDETIGIFEVFSARPHGFSSDDVHNLESLAAAAAQTVKAAREKAVRLPETPDILTAEDSSEQQPPLSVASVMQKVAPIDPAVKVLRWLVIGLAIPLVVLIGFDWGWHRAHAPTAPAIAARDEKSEVPPATAESTASNAAPNTVPAKPPKRATTEPNAAQDLSRHGGLVISQNGKVIFRETPTLKPPISSPTVTARRDDAATAAASSPLHADPSASADSSVSLPPGVSGGRLLQSVRPQYPAQAIAQRIQGSVVLHGTVAEDGSIRDLKPVSGDPVLAEASVQAVKQWKYEPYRRNGTQIAMPIDITVDFNLPK
jgi:TonB family protein